MVVWKGWAIVSKRGLKGLAPQRTVGFLISISSEKVIKRMKHCQARCDVAKWLYISQKINSFRLCFALFRKKNFSETPN